MNSARIIRHEFLFDIKDRITPPYGFLKKFEEAPHIAPKPGA
jgi:hypothetical protein